MSHQSALHQHASLINPVIRGFHPDPSVCRVGNQWVLVTSTFTYAPGLPVYSSRDLRNWKHVGHALSRPSQLPLDRCAQHEGIFAPTIRHHNGTFYLVTTSVSNGGNFMVTAENPAGPWSDPIWIDEGWFDPSLFFDTDGTVFYTRKGDDDTIVQATIDPGTGQLLTPLQPIARGFVSPDCEGPHLFHRGDWYYLLLAEGGTRTGHMATIGRSLSPWGPFEPCPWNPILTNRSLTNNPIRSIGHADFFDAPDGSWWVSCLGTRHTEYEVFSLLGRESFILPVHWTYDGWPVVNQNQPVDNSPIHLPWKATAPSRGTRRWTFAGKDQFDGEWISIRRPPDPAWLGPDGLTLQGETQTLDDPFFHHLAATRITERLVHIRTMVTALEHGEGGLTLYMDHRHHLDVLLSTEVAGNATTLSVRMRIGDAMAILHRTMTVSMPLTLSASLKGTSCEIACKGPQDKTDQPVGSWDIRYLAPEVAGTWTGLVAGLFAQGGGRIQVPWFEMGLGPPTPGPGAQECNTL